MIVAKYEEEFDVGSEIMEIAQESTKNVIRPTRCHNTSKLVVDKGKVNACFV
jgi:hypothetical protein